MPNQNEIIVLDLNDGNIDKFAKDMPNHGKVFIAFLADWCGHCQNFKPEWETIKQHLNTLKGDTGGHIVTVDDNLMKQLPCKQPSGFPTLSLYNGKEWKEDYNGARSKDELVEYLLNNMTKTPAKKHKTRKHRRRRRKRHHIHKRSTKPLKGGGKKKKPRKKTRKKKYKRRKQRSRR
jgi:thiol-disulfide isomerase/thioredoxin